MSAFLDQIRERLGVGPRPDPLPPLDGPLRQNDDLERCWPLLERLDGLDDVAAAHDGSLFVSVGPRILRYDEARAGTAEIWATLPGSVGGLAALRDGRVAACVAGEGVALLREGTVEAWIREAGGVPIACALALVETSDGALLIAEGSTEHLPRDWANDLLRRGAGGRLVRASLDGATQVLATGLRWPHGLCLAQGGATLLVAESWRHGVTAYPLDGGRLGAPRSALQNLPGYPARLAAASDGGIWLAVFAPRTQLVDFILRENRFRQAMVDEVPAEHWVAPSLVSSAHDPHPWKAPRPSVEEAPGEPLHAGRIRRFGQIKPWAPARSYGLVVKLDAEFDPVASLHARAQHLRHGITGVVEHAGGLYLACKGYGVLLKSSTLPGLERASEAVQKKKTARERIKSYLAAQGGAAPSERPFLEVRGATKRYGGVAAIRDVSFDLRAGELHALLGENGAGKSTLCKAMAGTVTLSEGAILVDGTERRFGSPADALKAGIAMVYQETSLVPGMSVAQNIQLGRERVFTSPRRLNIAMQQFLASISFGGIDASAPVASLGQGQKQMVEIARAIYFGARAIIFDEPTAALTPGETQRFFELIETLKRQGLGLVFISHNLEEAMDLADRITVMRDGRHAVTDDAAKFGRDTIIRHMVGRDMGGAHYTQVGRRQARETAKRRKVLTVENVRAAPLVKNMSLSLYENEITGLAGLVGSGRSEIARVIAGALKRDFVGGGVITLDGRPIRYRVPSQAIEDGIVYVTEDRKVDGFFETMGIDENIHLGALARPEGRPLLISRRQREAVGRAWVERLGIRAIDLRLKVNRLSGGNQQKVVVAKSLIQEPRVVIIDEPTRGVDVGAIAEMHATIRALKGPGRAVLVISSYLPEVLALSDRVLVARQGRIAAEFVGADATEDKIMLAAMG